MDCFKKSQACTFRTAIEDMKDLTPIQKKVIEERYLCLLDDFQRRSKIYALLFHSCRFIITVGSLIVPALLSIQYVDTGTSTNSWTPEDFTFKIYWSTWVISLLVTTANGIFTLFKVDKKYYLLHTMLEQLRSEGWQYLELSGRFSGFYTPREKPTHANQFLFFCHAVEKLKMKQVEEEYYKSMDPSLHTTSNTHSVQKHDPPEGDAAKNIVIKNGATAPQIPAFFADNLIPPTPLNPQLQQLLQALTVDGGGNTKQNTIQENAPEVPVRSEVSTKPTSKEPILRQTSKVLSAPESIVRVGTEISTESVEQKSKPEENA